MTRLRILILSGTRPLRARRIAERISTEIPGLEICGIVQHSLRQLPRAQQLIARGDLDGIGSAGCVPTKTGLWIRKIVGEMIHLFLWCVHGCPRGVHANLSFTVKDLATRCEQSSWAFLLAGHLSAEDVVEFARRKRPDLVIVQGQPSLNPELFNVPSRGLARVLVHDSSDDSAASPQEGIKLELEYFANGAQRACSLVSLHVPSNTYDEPLGRILKSDLIADDLLVQAAKTMGRGSHTAASNEVKDWVHRALSPYLEQFALPLPRRASFPGRYRSILKLCVHSFLGLPWVISRNWYRRIRSRYPVLILAHHLVSDRPHGMGIPTADLLRRIRFLQRQYRIVSLSEASDELASGSVSMPTVVLTFDDGYCDNYVGLRAVAEETGAKIVLFLATRQVELRQEFDHDLLGGNRGFFPLTWDQVEEWSRRGVEFGSHTRTHFDCGSRERARLEPEIVGSGQDVEMRLGRPCSFFAFPFGKRENMSPEAMQVAASSYPILLSSCGGENLPRNDHRQQHLLRKGFHYDPWELELEMQSVFDWLWSNRLRFRRWIASLRSRHEAATSVRQWSWTLLHAFLLLLALLPPFRRLLNEISGDQ